MDIIAQNWSWIGFAFMLSVFSIITPLTAEYFPGRMMRLLFLMRVFACLFLLPFFFILDLAPPSDPIFYICTISATLLFVYSDLVFFGLVAKSGAGVISRIEPLSAWFLFFGWTLVSPALLMNYISNPFQLTGLIFSLSLCVYFALRLKNCDVSWSALKRFAPILFVIVVATTLSKTAMNHSPLYSGVFYYSLCQCSTAAFVLGALFKLRKIPTLGDLDIPDSEIPERFVTWRSARYGILVGGGFVLSQISKYMAISLADNPAYVTVFGLLCPFWIMLFYRIIGKREEVDVLSGLGIVFSAALLVFFTAF
ncbi:MAG: hypothetical protein CBB87_02075 [Micavibrio sp. TMED27]|nr:hypothetical protein [Micavibrio sp.]OUT92549.1 MAG: hypothetical protein CBB87_02075 [Micavibrio sp. TMED27]|tara:strand:+ start:700 stop:1629 length:930 start_codon:yes stop_codon:yes gene_type:complete